MILLVLPLDLVLSDLVVVLNELCSSHGLLTGVSVVPLRRYHAIWIERCLVSGDRYQVLLTGA